jgi:beta-fructofuranosidase
LAHDANNRSIQPDTLTIDSSHSSLHDDVLRRPPEIAPFELRTGESLKLRVFIDRSIVEVFANGRQCAAVRVYPKRPDSLGVSIYARGGDPLLRSLDAWQMKSIYTEGHEGIQSPITEN